MSQSERDLDAEKIKERQWDQIRGEWANYVPDLESPWAPPETELFELATLEPYFANLGGPKGTDSTIEEEIEGFRPAVLHESVIMLHKAGNVLRAAAEEGSRGFGTWSRSSFYQSAFFSCRAVLGLLGVVVFRGRDRQSEYQIDLWAPRGTRRRAVTGSNYAVRIIRRRKVEHKEMWGIFSRVLRVADVDPSIWPSLDNHPLKDMASREFSLVRHQIHYRAAGWLFNDLDSTATEEDFSDLATNAAAPERLSDAGHAYFPPLLALHVYSLGASLLSDLGEHIPLLKEESDRCDTWMANAPWKLANIFASSSEGGS